MKSIAALAFALIAASGCHRSSDSPDFLAPGANSLGVTSFTFRFDGDMLVAQVPEEQGLDLNGDGDFVDAALEIFDLRTGRKTVLPYAANHGFEVGGGFVAFGVTECAQGMDLDGNGSVECVNVLFVHDLEKNRTTNLGLPLLRWGPWLYLAQEGPLMAFVVSEGALGRDLDGDGLATHDPVFAYEADVERLTPLSVSTNMRPILEGGRVFVAAREAGHGDKNGDGDTNDQVLHLHDVRSGATENLRRAVLPAFSNVPWMGVEGPLLALNVAESLQGVDQNGDGDLLDTLVEIRDLESGMVLPTNLPATTLVVEGGLVGIYAPEITINDLVGADFNGDGVRLHTVAFFYDWLTGTLTNTGIAVDFWADSSFHPPRMSDRRAVFVALEDGDENGDGDGEDDRLLTFDARSGATEPTGLSVFRENDVLDIDPDHAVCAAFVGSSELSRLKSFVVDMQNGIPVPLGLTVRRQRLVEGRALVAAFEHSGRDLNGDGDVVDLVQQVHDLRTGETFNTGLAVRLNDLALDSEMEFENGLLAVQAHEPSQGRDLNGDGDQDDFVLQVVRLP